MRLMTAAAALLMMCSAIPAHAASIAAMPSVETFAVVIPAAAKKKPAQKKKEKVEYMRAAPM